MIVPNSVIGKEPITNYSEPAVPTRLQLEVGVSYNAAPNDVKQAIHEVLAAESLVLKTPTPGRAAFRVSATRPSCIECGSGSTTTAATRSCAIGFEPASTTAFSAGRLRFRIPFRWSIRVSGHRAGAPTARPSCFVSQRAVDVLRPLTEAERAEFVELSTERLYGDSETVVRQGQPGSSMFLICSGRLRVTVEPSGAEVAIVDAGGYIGEMSLLTGDVRSATVTARGDAVLLEITADIFRRIVLANPTVLERISSVIEERRARARWSARQWRRRDRRQSAEGPTSPAAQNPALLRAHIRRPVTRVAHLHPRKPGYRISTSYVRLKPDATGG